jgi:hypothetical protein
LPGTIALGLLGHIAKNTYAEGCLIVDEMKLLEYLDSHAKYVIILHDVLGWHSHSDSETLIDSWPRAEELGVEDSCKDHAPDPTGRHLDNGSTCYFEVSLSNARCSVNRELSNR